MLSAASLLAKLRGASPATYGRYKYPVDVASANDLDLTGKVGGLFKVTGTTTINGIKMPTAITGTTIVLYFSGILTLAHNGSPSTGYSALYLSALANVTTSATGAIELIYDGTKWRERGIQSTALAGGTISLAGAATSVGYLTGKKLAIADNTATDLITVTVPNGNNAACIEITLLGSLGTGTDTFESTRCAKGMVVISRKAGDATVPAAATLTLAQISTDSGGGTLTLAYGVSAVTGAAGATNTFTIQVTLVKTGTITDLQCMYRAVLMNAEASGVTMAAA